MIFLETIRDAGNFEGVSVQDVVAHEVGHTAGYENPHRAMGIMRAKAFTGLNVRFDADSIKLFRTTTWW
jgi:hypothetical protein